MKIFLSYASEQRSVAEPLAFALESDGHEVFFDRHDLPEGGSYHDRIRDAIDDADRYVFLVSPDSVSEGSYALSELSLAQAKWPRPSGRVLPVMAAPTPFDRLPPYLGAVTVMQPKGNLAAEVAAHFDDTPARQRWWWLIVPVLLLAAFAWWWTQQQRQAEHARQQEAQRARAEQQARDAAVVQAFDNELKAAANLCTAGSHAAAWANFDELATRVPPQATKATLQAAQADCGMRWLRELSVPSGERFGTVTQKITPLLGREVAVAQGPRLGDLHAHLGWAEHLRWKDGTPTQPAIHYQRAIETDARNPYANAMWALHAVMRRDAPEQAGPRFDAALASGRDTDFVRRMQAGLVDIQGDQLAAVLRSLNAGRQRNEPAPRSAPFFYRRWCERDLPLPYGRGPLLAVMSPDDAIATIDWLQPHDALPPERKHLWNLCRTAYLVHAGRHAQADPIIKRTLEAMGKDYQGGSYERWAKEQLARFKPLQ